jgi:hypothetical protein
MTLHIKPTLSRILHPRRPAAPPPAKPKPAVASNRVVVARKPAPVDSLWYTIKVKLADFLCNLTVPKMEGKSIGDTAPAGLQDKMRVGDILVRRTEGTSGNFFIPSWWKHAAVYVGDGKVVEATFHGVQEITLDEFFAHGDHVAVLSPKNVSDTQRESVARYAKLSIGKPYDFDVNFDDDRRVTCTELAYQALIAGTGKQTVGKDWMGVVTGDDLVGASTMDVIYNSDPQHGGPAKA